MAIPSAARHAGAQLTMPGVARQAAIALVAFCFACGSVVGQEPPDGPHARQLRRECRELLALAVRRPYGIGWPADLTIDPDDRRPTVSMEPGATPAAGLVLLWAGNLLGESELIEAGVDVARGVAASQAPNGNILSRPQFGPRPGGRELPAAVPDRGPTRAGLALLLGAIGAVEERDDVFERSGRRAAFWLAKQQTHDGGWPTTAPADLVPPDSGLGEHYRLIRLDTRDTRDSTFALLLAADVLGDKLMARSAARAVQKLIALRLGGPDEVANLWTTFYQLSGNLEDKLASAPAGADILASRRVLEALVAAAVMGTDPAAAGAAREAARTLRRLRGEGEGPWRRLYPLDLQSAPPTAGESILGPPATSPADFVTVEGRFGLDDVLPAVQWLDQAGPEQLSDRISSSATMGERLAATIVGLRDDPLSIVAPGERGQEEVMFDRFDTRSDGDEAVPSALELRVRRLYVLLGQARAESLQMR